MLLRTFLFFIAAFLTAFADTPGGPDYLNPVAISGAPGVLTADCAQTRVRSWNDGPDFSVFDKTSVFDDVSVYDGGRSFWYVWQAPSTGFAIFQTAPGGLDTTLALHSGYSGPNPFYAGNDNATPDVTWSRLAFACESGQKYYLRVSSRYASSSDGRFELRWEVAEQFVAFAEVTTRAREAAGSFRVQIKREGDIKAALQVPIRILGETNVLGTASFAPGQARTSVQLPLVNDSVVQGDRTLTLEFGALPAKVATSAANQQLWQIVEDDDNPPNEAVENATVITGTSGQIAGTTVGSDLGEGDPAEATPDSDALRIVWYQWTAPVKQLTSFSFASWDLFPYPFFRVRKLAAKTAPFSSDPTFAADAGVTYLIGVGFSDDGVKLPFTLRWNGLPAGRAFFSRTKYLAMEEKGEALITVERTGGTADCHATVEVPYFGESSVFKADVHFLAGHKTAAAHLPLHDNQYLDVYDPYELHLTTEDPALAIQEPRDATLQIKDRDHAPKNFAIATAEALATGGGKEGNLASMDGVGLLPALSGADGSLWYRWTVPRAGWVEVDFTALDEPLDVVYLLPSSGEYVLDENGSELIYGGGSETYKDSSSNTFLWDASVGESVLIGVSRSSGTWGGASRFRLTTGMSKMSQTPFSSYSPGSNARAGTTMGVYFTRSVSLEKEQHFQFEVVDSATLARAVEFPDAMDLTFVAGADHAEASFFIPVTAVEDRLIVRMFQAEGGGTLGLPVSAFFTLLPATSTPPPGDLFAAPLEISGAAGSIEVAADQLSAEAADPFIPEVPYVPGFFYSLANSLWLRWTPPSDGSVRISATNAVPTAILAWKDAADGSWVPVDLRSVRGGEPLHLLAMLSPQHGTSTLAWELRTTPVFEWAQPIFYAKKSDLGFIVTVLRTDPGMDAATAVIETLSGRQEVAFATGQRSAQIVIPLSDASYHITLILNLNENEYAELSIIPQGVPMGTVYGLIRIPGELAQRAITITTTGTRFTGTLRSFAGSQRFRGKWVDENHATITLKNGLQITLQLGDSETSFLITTIVNGNSTDSQIEIHLPPDVDPETGEAYPLPLGYYTFYLTAPNDYQSTDFSTFLPIGSCFGSLRIEKNRNSRIVGVAADGAPFSAGVRMDDLGTVVLFLPMYGGKGGIIGNLFPDDVNGDGNYTWMRPAIPSASRFRAGFVKVGSTTTSPYEAPLAGLDPARALFETDLVGVSSDKEYTETHLYQLTRDGPTSFRVADPLSDTCRLRFNPATGYFYGSYYEYPRVEDEISGPPQHHKYRGFLTGIREEGYFGIGFTLTEEGSLTVDVEPDYSNQ